MNARYAWHLVVRNPRRTFTYLFGLALAVGLFAGILFFVDATVRQMTDLAIAPVRLDIVGHATTPDVNVQNAVAQIVNVPGILAAEPVYAADFATAVKAGQTRGTPSGRMFAISASYLKAFDLLQVSQGQFSSREVMISEAMAVSQNLKVGDRLLFSFTGLAKPMELVVGGIVNMDHADPLFASATEGENAIVADVVFVDNAWFSANLLAPLEASASNPPASLAPGAIILDPQVHIKIDRTLLPSEPTLAALQAESLRRSVERRFPGQLKAVDNLSGALTAAKGDVLSAKILFIFLGLPGVALAAYLSKFAAELFAEAQRREIGLLRTRGATPAQITFIVALASIFLAIGGSALGLAFGLVLLAVSGGQQVASGLNPLSSGFDWATFARSSSIAFLAGLVLTFLAAFLPTFGALHNEITQETRSVRRLKEPPFWRRAYLDILALTAAVIVLFVINLNGGFKPTGTEGQSIALSFYIFLAPLLTWIGMTLLILRLVDAGLARLTRWLAAFFGRLLNEIGEVAGKSIARRSSQVSAATTVIALTLSFGVSLLLFQQTYSREKYLDSQYVVGSDIRFTPAINTPQTADFSSNLKLPGVQSVTGVARDPQALVGSEKNTVYGIDVGSFRQTAYLPDSFFVDGSSPRTLAALRDHTSNFAPGTASQVLDTLANTPNGVIISVEQAQKYNILVGDPVLLRLYNRSTQTYTDVHTQAVGLFTYFPTSDQDSDFILNRDFMTSQSGDPSAGFFLIKTDGRSNSIQNVALALAARYKNIMPVRITSTETVIKAESSSLTSLNLGGLGNMEIIYTVLVSSLGLAIFLLAMVNERRREFGAMRALGANLGHLRRFLVAEAVTIGALSLIIGAVVGVILAEMLIVLLRVVFTIPPQALSTPGLELLGLALVVLLGMGISTLFSARRLAGLKVAETLRDL
jgi:putative ABC transport system permease protein